MRDLADELVQETWLTAVRRVRSFDPECASFAAWLRGIAANVLRNHLRARRRTRATVPLNGALSAPSARSVPTRSVVAQACVPVDRHEAVLRAKYLEQQSVADIAADWDETPKAVESLRAAPARRSAKRINCWSDPPCPTPLNDFLDRGFAAGSNDLANRFARATTRLLRRRRRLKRLAYLGRWRPVSWPAWRPCTGSRRPRRPSRPRPRRDRGHESGAAVNVEPDARNAVVLEWQARVQPAERVARLRSAASMYLNENQDYAAALRCYGDASCQWPEALAFSSTMIGSKWPSSTPAKRRSNMRLCAVICGALRLLAATLWVRAQARDSEQPPKTRQGAAKNPRRRLEEMLAKALKQNPDILGPRPSSARPKRS